MYGHTLGGAMGLGYVENPDKDMETADFINAGSYEIEIAGELFAATVSLKPLYDPKSDRVKA
jgi:4-methylaminobutanoate oxidase (formaldehyde-forming)